MRTATITVGISASGKSTYAGLLPTALEINRDDIRFGIVMPEAKGRWDKYSFSKLNEQRVSNEEDKLFAQAIEDGVDIVISNTNINTNIRREWIKRCKKAGFVVKVVLFNVSYKEAVERDSLRSGRSVGKAVILSQYEKLQGVLKEIEKEKSLYGIEVVNV